MFDVRSSLYGATFTPHADSRKRRGLSWTVKAKQMKPCAHAPRTRDAGLLFILGVSQERAFVRRSPLTHSVFKKQAREAAN